MFFKGKNFEVVPRPKLKMQLLEFSIRYIFYFLVARNSTYYQIIKYLKEHNKSLNLI